MMPVSYVKADANDTCAKELLLAYFPENFVKETLKKFNVPQDQWDGIAKDLAAKDKDVVKEVEDKAAKLSPNPLKDRSPEQRQAAVKIFREALFDIFSGVMKAHGVTDEKQVQAMLADIQQQKAKNFAQCMEKQKALFEKERSGQPAQSSPQTLPATPNQPSADEGKTDGSSSLADESEDTDKDEKQDEDEDSDNNKAQKPAPKPEGDSSKEFTLNFDDEYPDELQESDQR